MRLCIVPGCSGKHRARGYCAKHTKRLQVHGTLEGGTRTKPGEIAKFIEEVVLKHTADECLKWPFNRNWQGYPYWVSEGSRTGTLCRLICEKTKGPPPSPDHQCRHTCGKGHEGCCAPKHLEWGTRSENEQDKFIHGTSIRGERAPANKLTESQARTILALKGVVSQRKLAKMYNVTNGAISLIHNRTNWAWL